MTNSFFKFKMPLGTRTVGIIYDQDGTVSYMREDDWKNGGFSFYKDKKNFQVALSIMKKKYELLETNSK